MPSDNFNDTNGTQLDSHDANWDDCGSALASNMEIQDNEVQLKGSKKWQAGGGRYTTVTTDLSKIVIKAVPSGANDHMANKHVAVRASASVRGYGCYIFTTSGDNLTSVGITKNGAWFATLATGQSFSILSDHTLKVTASGTSTVDLEGFVDGSSYGTTQDSSSPYSSGNPGFFVNGQGDEDYSNFDDWADSEGATYNEATTLAAGAAITVSYDLEINPSLTLTAEAAQAQAGDLDMDEEVTLTADASQAQAGDLDIDVSTTLSAGAAQAQAGGLDFSEDITLTASGAITVSYDLEINPSLTLTADASQTQVGDLDMDEEINLAADASQAQAGNLVMDTSLALVAEASQAQAGGMDFSDTVTLIADAAQIQSMQLIIDAELSFTTDASISESSLCDLLGLLSFSADSNISMLVDLIIEALLQLSSDATVIFEGQIGAQIINEFITLIVQTSLGLDTTATTNLLLSLAAQAGLAFEGTIVGVGIINEFLTLIAQAGLSFQATVIPGVPARRRGIFYFEKISRHDQPLLTEHDQPLLKRHDKPLLKKHDKPFR